MELLRHIQSVFIKFLFNVLLVITLMEVLGESIEKEPEFLQPLDNLTMTQGRDVSFTCIVNNLGQYRVAWIKSDSKAILAIHTHMVALNPRLSVTHNGHNTWKLHISHVQLNDSGSYMCQVNTDPMRSQSGHLDVVVPPDILNSPEISADESVTNEGGNVQLMCQATGVPEPSVQWRREDGKDIVVRNEGREKQLMKQIEGERLSLSGVQRSDMGGYLCIASNGIPPTVSKRYDIQVNFPPSVKAVNQLVGAPVASNVVFQCIVEAFGRPLNTWYLNEETKALPHGGKYLVSESMLNTFTWQMNLTVNNLNKTDFETYTCASENALGKSDARIRLREIHVPQPSTTTATPHVFTTAKARRNKQHHQKNHHENKGKDALGPNQIQRESDASRDANAQSEVLTQNPVKLNGEKNRSQQQASIVPSRPPSWVFNHSNNSVKSYGNVFKYLVAFVVMSHVLMA